MSGHEMFDVIVVGGGPAGATAATDLAQRGHSVMLLDRDGRIKPCGGAVPPRLMREFAVPDSLLVARVGGARIVAPSERKVEMPIATGGYVGMVDRETFDEWLRERARWAGADRRTGLFEDLDRQPDGSVGLTYRDPEGTQHRVGARFVIGADGAVSAVARRAMPASGRAPYVFAYHEIVEVPDAAPGYDPSRCDVYYQGRLSPDFYGWVFPHGRTVSVGTGTAVKGFSLRTAVAALRDDAGLAGGRTVRREGAPLPLRPLPKWDDGRNVVLAGDAAGVVAPASGEGIYYAMLSGRLVGEAVTEALVTGDARALAGARKRFMREHGRVFWILWMMQRFWYSSDKRRERFVSICNDPDVQSLTWTAYMDKKLVRARPAAHARIFLKDMAHLLRLVSP
ncbi:geranylgeranyl diphosphate reductase [Amorphus orientalis]|uniref:Geranylgeranyl diphosphate reductase n=1 Tax=Amorphus orientalis TaxID=649198 RepID=A0AAE3VNZ4_9HYPH|nr:geranylgeranyl diphosphate reductase [Amorphus orientalis]MDQ0315470.1 geranylgeranyl reductase [Amorphus orientalis]